ncbi:HicB family protein [Companilactobacillus sp.]|uniref:HicB family protein n=1 Tax=Companilactobacillus sp. TaxID=2767905 RepID=UPI0026316E5D|nr:HicB family protein [Companilactobacillus sp.]
MGNCAVHLNSSYPIITSGKGVAAALVRAQEALGLALNDEKNLPKPSTIKQVQSDNPDKFVDLVAVDLDKAKENVKIPTVKKNTTIPYDLAKRAEQNNINFSRVLHEGLIRELGDDK